MKLVAAIIFLGVFIACGEIIPSTNAPTTVWSAAGVPGGIPTYRAVYTTVTPSSTQAQIQSAITNLPQQSVLYFSNGTFNLNGSLNVGSSSQGDNRTWRGAGMGVTILKFPSNVGTPALNVGQHIGTGNWVSDTPVVSALQGSSNVVIATATNINVGDLIAIDETNSDWVDFDGSGNGTSIGYNGSQMGKQGTGGQLRLRFYLSKVFSKPGSSTTLTVWPPLPFTFDTSLAPMIYRANLRGPTNFGLENLTLDLSNVSPSSKIDALDWAGTYGCWLKNVEIVGWTGFGLWARKNVCFDMSGCWIHDPGTNAVSTDQGYGMVMESLFGSMVTDNIIYRCESSFIFQNGCAGNVIDFNVPAFGYYSTTNRDPSSGVKGEWLQHDISGNHTPFPEYNLYEGNYTTYFQSDYFYGPSGFNTLFRNRIAGTSVATTTHRLAVSIDAKQRYYSVVGNSLGTTNDAPTPISLALPGVARTFAVTSALTGWVYDPGSANHTVYGDSANLIYRLGYPMSGNNDTGSNSNAVHDPFVKTNTLRHGNWDAATTTNGGIVWDPTIADHTIPSSMFLSAAPYFFGTNNYTWPPYGPSNAPVSMVDDLQKIPAGWRLLYGTNQPYGQLAVSTNLLDWGVFYDIDTLPVDFKSKYLGLTNVGNADLVITFTNPPTHSYAPGNGSRWFSTPSAGSTFPQTITLTPGQSTQMLVSYSYGHAISNGVYDLSIVEFHGGGGAIVQYRAIHSHDRSSNPGFSPSTNGTAINDFALANDSLSASADTVPFIPGQSGEAYLLFELTNRSVVNFTAEVRATNAVNGFGVEVNGEPTWPYSVWDIEPTGDAFETRNLIVRALGTADHPAGDPWVLNPGTYAVKIYSMTAGTAIKSVTANILPIMPNTITTGLTDGSTGITFQ